LNSPLPVAVEKNLILQECRTICPRLGFLGFRQEELADHLQEIRSIGQQSTRKSEHFLRNRLRQTEIIVRDSVKKKKKKPADGN